jgi:glycosyltransferase involved in cell wall biosynthesis
MKILHVCTSDFTGGAARAAYRLHRGLRNIGVDSWMLVQDKKTDDPFVIGPKTVLEKGIAMVRMGIDPILLNVLYRSREKTPWSFSWLPDRYHKKINLLNPDIVNLHWFNAGFLNIKTLKKIDSKLVWTLHDMWAFTGGCHYAGDCEDYKIQCERCPQLNCKSRRDLSYYGFRQKRSVYKSVDLNLVALSRWMKDCVDKSALLSKAPITLIPNGIDTGVFKPIKRDFAREVLNIPEGYKIILFGAMNSTSDVRKGYKYLKEALELLSNKKEELLLLVFGASQDKEIEKLPFQTRFLGRIYDDYTLSLIYSSADVFVAPSIEDNLPNTVMEASACGVPSVAFDVGGLPDMISHKSTGYLAKPFLIKDLAEGISFCISKREMLGENARLKVQNSFAEEIQARRYKELYEKILTQ